MLDYNTIIEMIRKNYTKIHDIEQQTHTANNYNEKNLLREQKTYLEDVNKVLCNNSRRALFNEVFPKVLNILTKYNNKPLGEKTKDKIKAETKEALNCSIWFEEHYIHIIMLNENGFSKCGDSDVLLISTNKYDNYILSNNRLQVYVVEEYYLLNTRDYIENVEEYLQNLAELKRKIKEAENILESLCDEYNAAIVNRMKRYDYSVREV